MMKIRDRHNPQQKRIDLKTIVSRKYDSLDTACGTVPVICGSGTVPLQAAGGSCFRYRVLISILPIVHY